MDNFGIMLKSYGPDLQYAQRFLESFLAYATEPIPLYVVVPDQDLPAFTEVFASHATVLPESLWSDQLVDYPIHGNNPGYINQEIIKLTFAESGYLRNYLCADSAAVFIRPFSSRDFIDPTGVPYSFITEDHELHVDPVYFDSHWQYRDKWLKTLREFLQLPKDNYLTCHGFAVLHSEYVQSLLNNLRQKEMTVAEALEICPYEFSWYNFWVEKNYPESRIIREPIFKTIHMSHQHLGYALKGIDLENLSRGYVGVVVNSGHSRDQGVLDFDNDFIDTLARNLGYGALAGGIIERALQRAPRVRKIFKV